MFYTLLIPMFCKNNVLHHIKRTGGCYAIFVECTAYCCDQLLFSSSGRSPGRAIVQAPASASVSASVAVSALEKC